MLTWSRNEKPFIIRDIKKILNAKSGRDLTAYPSISTQGGKTERETEKNGGERAKKIIRQWMNKKVSLTFSR